MVIPLGDRQRPRRTPWVTWALVLANVAVFFVATPWWGGPCTQARFYLDWATVPAEVTSLQPLDADQVAEALPEGCEPTGSGDKIVVVSLVTALFLHGGWLHLTGNMVYLAAFGRSLEDRLGALRYASFYLVTGVLASLVFVAASPASTRPLAGASGAIAGVLAGSFRLLPRRWVTVLVPWLFFLPIVLPSVVVIGLWFALELVALRIGGASGGGVATLAHVAGFVGGFVLAPVWAPTGRGSTRRGRRRKRR